MRTPRFQEFSEFPYKAWKRIDDNDQAFHDHFYQPRFLEVHRRLLYGQLMRGGSWQVLFHEDIPLK